MSLMDSLRKLFKEDQVKRIIEPIGDGRTDEASLLILPEVHYFRIRLVEMFIDKKRWFGKTWYPAVQGLISATYGSEDLELPSVADTSKLFDEQKGTGDIAVRNFGLTPLMPYRGGTVEIFCGLFGMEGQNNFGKVIKLLSDFSGLLAVPQLTQVLNVAGPLVSGVQDLFAADGKMHLGYHDQWVSVIDPQNPAANAFRSGYIAIIRADDDEVDRTALRVENQQLRLVKNGQSQPFTGKDHILIHIEGRSERDDLKRLTSFYTPFNQALKALGDLKEEEAKTLMRQTLATARTSPDLTDADRSRVTQKLKETYLEAKSDADFLGLVEDETTMVERLRPSVSAAAAYDAGVPTLEELWDGL